MRDVVGGNPGTWGFGMVAVACSGNSVRQNQSSSSPVRNQHTADTATKAAKLAAHDVAVHTWSLVAIRTLPICWNS